MEFQSTNPVDSYKLKLPKCGNERNILDCYKLTDKQLSDEVRCIATLTSSEGYLHQERMENPGNNQPKKKPCKCYSLVIPSLNIKVHSRNTFQKCNMALASMRKRMKTTSTHSTPIQPSSMMIINHANIGQ